ncbi:sugar ABC transporter substrate-binding protein [Streptomyces sp. NPDC048644]|uniref:sugar ABC transporter substrate-binding protein n=1 Tax=Streptomyces sp. NPDC048644 TaxID=3365582 RepID=UPI00372280CF
MNAPLRRTLTGAMALSLAVPLAACGSDHKEAGASEKSIGLLLPENKASRYEDFDRRIISSKVASRCLECRLDYHNAKSSVDAQRQQFDALVKKGVKVIILDPVDAQAAGTWVDAAARKGVKVVSYDRLAEGKVAAYVSYDNEKIGRLQGEGLVAALGSRAATADVVMLNGSPADPNSPGFKKGAHAVLDHKVHKIVYERDITGWSASKAGEKMTEAVKNLGPAGFDAVYSANDGMAGGIADALKSAGVSNVPLSGQDAELTALQRILKGTQSFTVYKEVRPEAQTAGDIAVNLLQGKSITSLAPTTVTGKRASGIPAKLFSAKIVTRNTMQDTVIRDGAVRADLICTEDLKAACKSLGIS